MNKMTQPIYLAAKAKLLTAANSNEHGATLLHTECRVLLSALNRQAGRKQTDNPALGTIYSRKSREKKKIANNAK